MRNMEFRRREREILHNYMEFLAANHKEIEPAIMTDSICKLHSELNSTTDISIKFCGIILAKNHKSNRQRTAVFYQQIPECSIGGTHERERERNHQKSSTGIARYVRHE